SSRRRHTRFDCDWSSDVCSSDLEAHRKLLVAAVGPLQPVIDRRLVQGDHKSVIPRCAILLLDQFPRSIEAVSSEMLVRGFNIEQIGRASCRERVYMSVMGGFGKE